MTSATTTATVSDRPHRARIRTCARHARAIVTARRGRSSRPPRASPGDERFVRRCAIAPAGCCRRPSHDALADLADGAPQAGALLLRGLPDRRPAADTRRRPAAHVAKDRTSELTLLTVARRLGQPVGYEPEHGGDLVQNIVPTAAARRPPGVDLVARRADVPHRGGVPPAPAALPAAAVPARRPGGRHARWRRSTRCSPLLAARRRRRAVRAALPHRGRRELPARPGATCSARRCPCSRGRPRPAVDGLRRRPDGRHRRRGRRRAAGAGRRGRRAPHVGRARARRPAGRRQRRRGARPHARSPRASTAPTAGCSARSSSPTSRASAADRHGRVITTRFGA